MGGSGSKSQQANDVKWLKGLPGAKEESSTCGVCKKRFGCFRKPVLCRLCGGWVCLKCCELRKLFNGAKRPLLRWCHGCTESKIMKIITDDTTHVWSYITSYLDTQSLNAMLQVSRATQISLPLPYLYISKWEAMFGKSKFLAKGSYGSVQRALCKEYDNKVVAIKTIRKRSVHTMRKWKVLLREIEIQNCIDHEYAIKLVGPKVLQTKTEIYIVMELADEDLFDRIVKRGPIPEPEAKELFRQLMTVLAYLHSVGVVHRDIKPENIMLRNNKVKLADFGFTKLCPSAMQEEVGPGPSQTQTLDVPKSRFDHGLSTSPMFHNGLTSCTPCGTYGFAAPELIDTSNRGAGNGSKAWLKDSSLTSLDVFASGIVLHIMLTGYEPFPCKSTGQHLAAVKRGLKTQHAIYKNLSPEVIRLLCEMTCYSSALRPSAAGVLGHPWLNPVSKTMPVFTASCGGPAEFGKPEMMSLKERGRSVVGAAPCFTISDTGEVLFCPSEPKVKNPPPLTVASAEAAEIAVLTTPLMINATPRGEFGYGSYCAYTPEMTTRSLSQFSSPEKEEEAYSMYDVEEA
eukprot:TRINITY_DN2524_c3_g1_i1.p1 TRINITY_DN2524_c3_g1~~TRINITY_DN2524_c3_g1_i1.p1  ORF type:complete len:570 (+),score=154.16 TRINITY_DN2524_c3_g1_i1:44-1753(+)